jgi:hypothetical protein
MQQFLRYGAAQESNLSSMGLPPVTGLEGLLRLLSTLQSAIAEVLIPHQRRALVALARERVRQMFAKK